MKPPTDDASGRSDATTDQEACPQCGAVADHEQFSHAALLAWLTVWPILPVRRRYSCGNCGHTWKRLKW